MVLLFAVRPATAVGVCQMPSNGRTAEWRVPQLPHCGGRGITAIALSVDENGRDKPTETAVGRRHHGGRRELLAAAAAARTPAAP